MKDACKEKYIFYNFAIIDLDDAFGCLDAIKQYKHGLTSTAMVSTAIVKYAIIAYLRPFTLCKGIDNKKKRPLSIEDVPEKHRNLHSKLLDYRDCIIAHTDLDFRNPKLVKHGMTMKREEDYLALVGEMQLLIREVRSAVHNMIIEYGKKVN